MDRRAPPTVPSWSRLTEWALVAGVVVALILALARQTRLVQGQTELAAVQFTLGSLRTAMVIDHLQKKVSGVASPQRNPFELLQRRPPNYAGEMSLTEGPAPAPGSWVFDPTCVCVGYLPLYPQWFDSPSGEPMAWFHVDGAPGPLQLSAKENYSWQNAALR